MRRADAKRYANVLAFRAQQLQPLKEGLADVVRLADGDSDIATGARECADAISAVVLELETLLELLRERLAKAQA